MEVTGQAKVDFSPYMQVAIERSSRDVAHDFSHVQRVLGNARRILQEIPADDEIVIPAILLHELFNYPKGHPQSHLSGNVCAEQAAEVLCAYGFPEGKRDAVLECIRFHSFSRGVVPTHIEGKIVQDADRLDAIGAIGIARLFATCVQMQRPFYHATDPFAKHRELDDKNYGLDHFYLKLFKLSEGMHTAVAREIARHRTQFMQDYIAQLTLELGI